jgi:hypothetical protein
MKREAHESRQHLDAAKADCESTAKQAEVAAAKNRRLLATHHEEVEAAQASRAEAVAERDVERDRCAQLVREAAALEAARASEVNEASDLLARQHSEEIAGLRSELASMVSARQASERERVAAAARGAELEEQLSRAAAEALKSRAALSAERMAKDQADAAAQKQLAAAETAARELDTMKRDVLEAARAEAVAERDAERDRCAQLACDAAAARESPVAGKAVEEERHTSEPADHAQLAGVVEDSATSDGIIGIGNHGGSEMRYTDSDAVGRSLSWGAARVHEFEVTQEERDEKRSTLQGIMERSDDEQQLLHEQIVSLREQLGDAASRVPEAARKPRARGCATSSDAAAQHSTRQHQSGDESAQVLEVTCPSDLGPARQIPLQAGDGADVCFITVPSDVPAGAKIRVHVPQAAVGGSVGPRQPLAATAADSSTVQRALLQDSGTHSAVRSAVDAELAKVQAELAELRRAATA